MSISSFIAANKVLALKIGVVTIIGASAAVPFVVKQQAPSHEEILGVEEATVVPTAVPTEKPEDIVKLARKTAEDFIDTSTTTVRSIADTVRDTVTSSVQQVASKSADTVSHTVIQNTTTTIMQQIEKLPEKEKQVVKDVVCK